MSETTAADEHDLVGALAPPLGARNVGPGPGAFDFDSVDGDTDAVVRLLMGDYHCTNCRAQADRVADRYDAFRQRGAEVVALLPEPATCARARADTPYPLLADPETAVAGEDDQPVRVGLLGSLSGLAGRRPEAVVVDVTGDPVVAYAHRGEGYGDRPTTDDLLAIVEEV